MEGTPSGLSYRQLVVGAGQADGLGDDSGCAHVFARVDATWAHHTTLIAGDSSGSAAGSPPDGPLLLRKGSALLTMSIDSDSTIRCSNPL